MARITATQRKKSKQKESAENEENIQKASHAISKGTFKHMSEAARHFDVPYDTLCR
jgi:helix-turn-helix, Psq domain